MLILASSSPRRADLLRERGYVFRVCPAGVEETLPSGMAAEEGVRLLALRKAAAGAGLWLDSGGDLDDVVLGADTLVILNRQSLGKPQDKEEAREMLRSLSGVRHKVCTGIALVRPGGAQESGVVETAVTFRKLSAAEIDSYVASGEPLDKAGAYGIQGGARRFVERLEGSLTNVIGLPMEYLAERLKAWGVLTK